MWRGAGDGDFTTLASTLVVGPPPSLHGVSPAELYTHTQLTTAAAAAGEASAAATVAATAEGLSSVLVVHGVRLTEADQVTARLTARLLACVCTLTALHVCF